MIPRIALTSGEPAGIGPELCLALALTELPAELVCLGDATLLEARARELNLAVSLEPYHTTHAAPTAPHRPGTLRVAHEPLAAPSVAGCADPANAPYVLALLNRAIDGALAGEFAAVVTAPVHKGVINDAGVDFTGHTEYFAARTHSPRAVMMLVAGGLRVALATTHLPLRAVSAALTTESLCEVGTILARELAERFGLPDPRIAVCGLNPHAGEGGLFGDEERAIIGPAISDAQKNGVAAEGPFGADTMFLKKDYDAFVVMLHDQGHIMAKTHASAGAAALTIGTPVLFSSVAHGSALDIAGKNRADPRAMIAAIRRLAGASRS